MVVCVYAASSENIDPVYISLTEQLGEALAKRGHVVVFGGGREGLMGAIARGVKKGGGHLTGIAPAFFDKPGILFEDCDEMIIPASMRERKKLMQEKADAFLVLPGGVGTMDEFFETIVLKAFGLQQKPLVFYNIKGYFKGLVEMMETGVKEGFISEKTGTLYSMFERPEELILYLDVYSRL